MFPKKDLVIGLLGIVIGFIIIIFSKGYSKLIQDSLHNMGLSDWVDERDIKIVGFGGIILGLIILTGLYKLFR